MSERYIGIEIGGTKLQVVLGDGEGRILERFRAAVDKDRGAAGIREEIARGVRQVCPGGECSGVGVGFGGPIDIDTGRVAVSHHVEGWAGFELRSWLADLTGLAVRADNDANVAALGEALRGAGRGRRVVFYVTLGSGMGGGLVVDGRVFHGSRPGECEIGHMRVDAETTFESRCRGWAVDARVRRHVREHPGGVLARLVGKETKAEARFLAPALERGDEGAREILAETAETLALGLSHAVHLLHPEIIVLGGGLSLVGEPLRAAVADHLPRLVMRAFHPPPPVALSALGEDVVCVGALLLACGKG